MMRIAALVLCLCVASCGFRPLYDTGSTLGGGNTTVLDQISIDDIPGGYFGSGVALKNNLIDRFYYNGYPENAPYVLKVSLGEMARDIIIQKNDVTTRTQLVLIANYQLIDRKTRAVIDGGSIRAVGAYNVLQSQYTTLVTQNKARELALRELADKITMRMAVVIDKKLTKAE